MTITRSPMTGGGRAAALARVLLQTGAAGLAAGVVGTLTGFEALRSGGAFVVVGATGAGSLLSLLGGDPQRSVDDATRTARSAGRGRVPEGRTR